MKKLLSIIALSMFILCSCTKSGDQDNNQQYGTMVSTWTFTEDSHTYAGGFLFDSASLLTSLSPTNTYFFDMLGFDKDSGFVFDLVLNLDDTTFTRKNYQTGIDNPDVLDGLFLDHDLSSGDHIYKSSDQDPGPVINYTFTSYDATKRIVTIEFNGKAERSDGSYADITNGKITVPVLK